MRRPIRALLALSPALLLVACGATTPKAPEKKAGGPCDAAESRLRKHLGPELQGVVKRIPVFKPAQGEVPAAPMGCAVVFTLVPEELAEEGLGEEAAVGGTDQRLAFLTPDPKARWTLTVPDPSPQSPGPVDLEIETADLTQDGVPEVIVRESSLGADSYQGLRLFSLTLAPEGPRELLSESLKIKTPEEVELFAQWKATQAGGQRRIVFEAGGASRIFAWSENDKRYQFDEAATTAANPKPVAPPSDAAPASAPASGSPAIELP
jgi:hypothetical protein